MSFYITTDATCDLDPSFYKENFAVIPMIYTIDGVEYDGITRSLTPQEFYQKINEGAMPTTTLINEFTAKEFFRPILEQGFDILHIGFTSGLSGSFQCVSAAAEELKAEFPARKIIVLDSFSATLGQGLICYYVLKRRDEGKSFEEVCTLAEYYCKNMRHVFTVDDLFHLFRGGRLSKTAAILGTALNLKPVLHISREGKLVPLEKVISRKKAIIRLVERMLEDMQPPEKQELIMLVHSECAEDVEFLKRKIEEKTGITHFHTDYVGPVIGSHTGCGALAVFYLGRDDIEKK